MINTLRLLIILTGLINGIALFTFMLIMPFFFEVQIYPQNWLNNFVNKIYRKVTNNDR